MKVVVVDTNVIFSGLYSRKGASYLILELIGAEKLKPALSVGLYEEYADVLGRPPLVEQFNDDDRNDFLDYICSVAHLTEIIQFVS